MIQKMFATVDIKKTNYKNVGKINHGDDLLLEIRVLSDGNTLSFNNPMVDLLVKKSDGKMVRQTSGIELIKPNIFVIEVSKDCVTSPGLTTNQLIINDDGRVSTCMFYYTVLNSLEEDVMPSISNVEVLEQLDEFVVQIQDKMELFDSDLAERMDELTDSIVELEKNFNDTSSTLNEAEVKRSEAEQLRVQAEVLRVQNEDKRAESENVRDQNESDRAAAELVREQREVERVLNDEERHQNESERAMNEELRQRNENVRQSNEATRIANETDRKTQENRRVTAETNRVNAETTRRNNENSRISNETERQKAMNEMKSLLEDARGFDERVGVIEDEIDEINSSLDTKETKTTLEILSANMSATGDCMILKTKNGTTILCDTGSSSRWSEVDTFLGKNIDKLDYVIITHYHSDHVGNLENILKKYKSDNCIAILPCEPNFEKMNINGEQFRIATQNTYELFDEYNITRKIPVEGEVLEIDDIKIKFLNCSLDLFENYYNTQSEFYSDGSTDYNNFSLVFELIHNNNKMLFTGDINVTAQETLLPYLQKYDLLKCPHHSVDTNVHLPFMQKTSPTLAFSNNNGQNSLPKSEITRWLLTRGIPYYVTCQTGDLKLISDGFKITSDNKTYAINFNMKGFLSSFGVSNYMYFGFEDISKKYSNMSTLEDMIKEMKESSSATVNFISGDNVTPDFISTYNGSGFIQKVTNNKATILLFDNKPDTFNCYIGLWHSSEESVVWHKLGSDEKIENLNKKVKLTLYNTYGSMSGLGISSSSTALEMVKAMPASSLYSGYVTQSFDSNLDTYGAMVDIKKSSNNLIAKITMTSANPKNMVMYEGIYHQNVGDYIKWKKITLTDV